MRKIKLGRAFVLSILGVLSMMALFAVSAQADLFLLEKKAAAAGSTIGGTQVGVFTFLILVINLEINCTAGELEAGSSLLSDTVALVKVFSKGCTALNHKTKAELSGCTVPDILAVENGLPKVAAKEQWVLFEPDGTKFKEKEVLTTITLTGEACALKGVYPITGSIVALVDGNESVKPELLFSSAISAAYAAATGEKDEYLFGPNATHLTGTFQVFYTGADAGKLFGIC
jgi:hypothetical protein